MLIQVQGQREEAIHALINTWLKIDARWCLNCGKKFDERAVANGDWPCCDSSYLTTNQLVFHRFIKDMKEIRAESANKFASTKGKTLRLLLRFPPGLFEFLDCAMKRLYDEPLFTEDYNQQWFAKKFERYFVVPQEI